MRSTTINDNILLTTTYLREFGEETSERYEYIPAQLIVIEDVCKKYSCACTVKTAGKPSQPIEKSTAGASLLTQVIVAKYADHRVPRTYLQQGRYGTV
jgi:transposase